MKNECLPYGNHIVLTGFSFFVYNFTLFVIFVRVRVSKSLKFINEFH